MTHFSLTLNNALRDNDVVRKDFQKALDVGFPAVSKYLNGKALPKPPVLAKIMKLLPKEVADEVFQSYMKELFQGTNLAKLANSVASGGGEVSEEVYDVENKEAEPKDLELEYTISLLREMALRKKEVAVMLKSISDTLSD